MEEKYMKKGNVGGAVGALVTLVVGIGVVTLIVVFVGAMAGQTYQLVEPQINAITNDTVKQYVRTGIINGFSAFNTTTTYIPIVVLAVIISLVLYLVLGFTDLGGRGMSGGSAL